MTVPEQARKKLLTDLETIAKSSDTGERWMGQVAMDAHAIIAALPLVGVEREDWSDEEQHAVGHAKYQVERATADNPEVGFDYELVATLLRLIERLALPAQAFRMPEESARDALPDAVGVEREDVARAAQEAADRITRSLAISGWTPRRSNIESARNDLLKIAESLALPTQTEQREDVAQKDKLIEKLHVIAKNVSHALMSFTPGGSEYFTRVQVGDFEDYYADADACQRRVRERIDKAEERARARALPAQAWQPMEAWQLVPKEPTDAMLEMALDVSGQRVAPFTAERESGVALECDISEQDAADINEALIAAHCETYCAMLSAAPASQPLVEGQWQPISTAPKEPMDGCAYGPTLLLVVDGQLGVGFWDYDFKKFYVEYPECGSQPTRWMLPPMIAEQQTEAK